MAETLSAALLAAKNRHASDSPMVWLAELDATGLASVQADADDIIEQWVGAGVIRLCFHTEDVTYNGHRYRAIGGSVEGGGIEPGTLLEQTIQIANVDRRLLFMLHEGAVLDKPITMKRVVLDSLATTTHHQTFRYLLKGAVATDAGVVFQLGALVLKNQLLPKFRFLRYRCWFTFKDDFCRYSGVLTTCDKTYDGADGCLGRSNQARYGGHPTLMSGPFFDE